MFATETRAKDEADPEEHKVALQVLKQNVQPSRFTLETITNLLLSFTSKKLEYE